CMGPGFESQRDHKKKLNRKIGLFLCPPDSNEGLAWVRFGEGSGMSLGNAGLSQPQRDHKNASTKVGAFLCPLGSSPGVRSVGGSGKCRGMAGLSQSQRDHLLGQV